MKNKKLFIINTIVLAVLLIVLFFNWQYWEKKKQENNNIPQVQSVSDGNIKITYDKIFGLAVTKDQVPVKSYIPPCDENFDYCFYYNVDNYKGTNFESAGIRIKKRTDLNSSTCLTTPLDGFDPSTKPDATNASATYSTSVFSNVGQGAAGHYTSGALYRLYVKEASACYEFETRIGETQFANYPEGTIKQFTDNDRNQVKTQLMSILEGITLKDGQTLKLP